jgi:hypothetical protein
MQTIVLAAFVLVVVVTMALAEDPWWLRGAQYQSPIPLAPTVQPIVPTTTCPPNQEMYFSKCRNDCRYGPWYRKRIA